MKKIMFNDKFGLTQAVLEGRKTMTRRIIGAIPALIERINGEKNFYKADSLFLEKDMLWIEYGENKCYMAPANIQAKYSIGETVAIAQAYKETIPQLDWVNTLIFKNEKGWTNKMFVKSDLMQHRIRITDIKVELLKNISDKDCLKEGIFRWAGTSLYHFDEHAMHPYASRFHTPQEAFAYLIDKVSGKGIWESNPWVFAYSFELVE